MEPLTWTGSLGAYIDPVFIVVGSLFLIAVIAQVVGSFVFAPASDRVMPDGTLVRDMGPNAMISVAVKYTLMAVLALIVLYIVLGMITPAWHLGNRRRAVRASDTCVDRTCSDLCRLNHVQTQTGTLRQIV